MKSTKIDREQILFQKKVLREEFIAEYLAKETNASMTRKKGRAAGYQRK